MLPKTGGCATGTGVEIAEGAETGGGVTGGEISPPIPSTPSLSATKLSVPEWKAGKTLFGDWCYNRLPESWSFRLLDPTA